MQGGEKNSPRLKLESEIHVLGESVCCKSEPEQRGRLHDFVSVILNTLALRTGIPVRVEYIERTLGILPTSDSYSKDFT